MHKKGSKYIENNLMNVKDIPLSRSFEKDVFKQKGWEVVVDKIQDENPIMVQIQVKVIFFKLDLFAFSWLWLPGSWVRAWCNGIAIPQLQHLQGWRIREKKVVIFTPLKV